jgi:hypothetical protein
MTAALNVYGNVREYDTDLDVFGVVFEWPSPDAPPLVGRLVAAGAYSSGIVAGESYQSGHRAAQMYSSGIVAGSVQ